MEEPFHSRIIITIDSAAHTLHHTFYWMEQNPAKYRLIVFEGSYNQCRFMRTFADGCDITIEGKTLARPAILER